jgi:hypothetical protein
LIEIKVRRSRGDDSDGLVTRPADFFTAKDGIDNLALV